MARRKPEPFHPPTAQQVTEYLGRYFVTGPSRLIAWLPAIVLGAAVFLAMTWTNQGLTLLVWFMLGGLFIAAMARSRHMRDIENRLIKVQEFSLERSHVDALRVVWRLIPQLRAQPQMHAKAVALLAHNLGQVNAYDAAVVAFDHVIDKLPDEHPVGAQLRVEQVMALLAGDQLTDADTNLRRLRSTADRFKGTPVESSYQLALMYQRVCTNHFQDALEDREGLITRLRPLGVDAAYGYAMMALSCFHMRHREDDPPLLDQAVLWWERATLLLPVETLIGRFEAIEAIRLGPAEAAKAADAVSGKGQGE